MKFRRPWKGLGGGAYAGDSVYFYYKVRPEAETSRLGAPLVLVWAWFLLSDRDVNDPFLFIIKGSFKNVYNNKAKNSL